MEAKPKRKKRPVNGLSPELMEAMNREYDDWQSRVQADDSAIPAALSADERFMLESGRMLVPEVQRIRKLIFSDLVSRGFNESEVSQRLHIGNKTYTKLLLKCFGVSNPLVIRARCTATTLARLKAVQDERGRMVALRQSRRDNQFISAERDAWIKLVKLEQDCEESLRKLHAADAPEQEEIKVTHNYAISFDVNGTREELAGLLESDIIDGPALPSPEVADGR